MNECLIKCLIGVFAFYLHFKMGTFNEEHSRLDWQLDQDQIPTILVDKC